MIRLLIIFITVFFFSCKQPQSENPVKKEKNHEKKNVQKLHPIIQDTCLLKENTFTYKGITLGSKINTVRNYNFNPYFEFESNDTYKKYGVAKLNKPYTIFKHKIDFITIWTINGIINAIELSGMDLAIINSFQEKFNIDKSCRLKAPASIFEELTFKLEDKQIVLKNETTSLILHIRERVEVGKMEHKLSKFEVVIFAYLHKSFNKEKFEDKLNKQIKENNTKDI